MSVRTALIFEEKPKAKEQLLALLRLKNIKVIYVETITDALKYVNSNQIDVIFSQEMDSSRLGTYDIPLLQLSNFSQNLLEAFLSQCSQKKKQTFIAESQRMKELLEKAEKIAKSEANVFITGESGTGKEVLANFIHSRSKRVAKPFVQVNCAAIPDTLLESEFFGHVKGAFTGAVAERKGRFEMANAGTLLLDEVSEIPLSLQAKLLRAIQEQEFEKIGSNDLISVSIRFIATSNRDVDKAIKEGSFREDLFYRLGVVPLYLPPLRDRIEDIAPLALHFLKVACTKNHLEEMHLSDDAIAFLKKYRWPGNVRELSNVIEHAAVLCEEDVIEVKHLPLCEQSPLLHTAYPFAHLTLKEVEKIHILQVLHACNNNKTRAAEMLGMSIRTLRNKLNA